MSAVPRFTPPIALMDPGHPQYSHFPSSRLGIDEEDEHEEVGTHASSSSHLTTDPSHITSSLVDSENRSSQGLRSSDDGTSHQDNMISGNEETTVAMFSRPVLSAATISRDGQFTAAITGHTLLVWKWIIPRGAGVNAEHWKPDMRTYLEPGVKYMSMILARNNLEVIVAGSNGTVCVIHRATGDLITSLVHTSLEIHGGEMKKHASYYAVYSVRASPRESFLATCGGNGEVMIWDVVTKRRLGIVKEKSEDEKDEDERSNAGPLSAKIASLLRPESWELLDYEPKHYNAISACDLSADDRWLAIGGEEQTLELWNISKLKSKGEEGTALEIRLETPEKRLLGHEGGINAIAFSPSAHRLISLDVRGMLFLWDRSRGTCLASFMAHSMVGTAAAFVPGEAEVIMTAGLDRFVKIWNLESMESDASAASIVKPEPMLTLRGHDSGIIHALCLRRGMTGMIPKQRQPRTAAQDPSIPSTASASSSSSTSAAGSFSSSTCPPLSILCCGIDQRLSFWMLGMEKPIVRSISLALHAFGRGEQLSHTAIKLADWNKPWNKLATCAYQDPHIHLWEMVGPKVGELSLVLRGLNRGVTAMRFTVEKGNKDMVMMAAGDEGGKVCLWRIYKDHHGVGAGQVEDPAAVAIGINAGTGPASSPLMPASPVNYTKANLLWFTKDGADQSALLGGIPASTGRRTGGPADMIFHARKKEAGLFWDADCTWSNQHESPIRSVTFSHSDDNTDAAVDWLISCDAVSMIRIFDLETKELIHTIHGGEAPIGPIYLVKEPLSLLRSTAAASGGGGGEGGGPEKLPTGAKAGVVKKKVKEGKGTAMSPQWARTVNPFLITHTRQEILVWHAKTGQIYASQSVCGHEKDSIRAMAFLPPSSVSSSVKKGCIRIAVLTDEKGPIVWDLALPFSNDDDTSKQQQQPPPSHSIVHDLQSSLTSQGYYDVALTDLRFCSGVADAADEGKGEEEEGKYLMAWGAKDVAIWSLMRGQGEGSPYYSLVTVRPFGGAAAFMKGPISVDIVADVHVRVVLKEGWVVDDMI